MEFIFVIHVYALVNVEAVSVVKVTWNVFDFVAAIINVKTKVLCKYSRYITCFLNKSYLFLPCFYMFLIASN